MYSDRSKAPYNQLHKLNVQKDDIVHNNPQSAIEFKKQRDNYSYDQRLKHLQNTLISANKHDKVIRKELEDDKDSEYSDEQNIDELEPIKVGFRGKKAKHAHDFTDRLHIPREGPNSKKNRDKKSMYVLSLNYS